LLEQHIRHGGIAVLSGTNPGVLYFRVIISMRLVPARLA
jgi:hypothetical protein